jgi:hypothetical protein
LVCSDDVAGWYFAAVASLTKQVQDNSSQIYNGTHVTNYIDSLWGVQVNGWDVSLKLTYAIEVVGDASAIQENYFLNQGGLGVCDFDTTASPVYCEFERFFEDDVSRYCFAVLGFRTEN